MLLAWQEVKHNETIYLGKFNNKTTSPETPHEHILVMVLFCPKPNFIDVKHAKRGHHVKLGIILPHLHINFIKFGATVN